MKKLLNKREAITVMWLRFQNISEFYRSIFDVAEKARADGLVLYGAGFWGGMAERIFKLFDVSPSAFCDDDVGKQGKFFADGNVSASGMPIMALDEAARLYPNAVYIAAATGGVMPDAPRAAMNRRLKERGLLSVYSGFHPVRYLFLLEGVLGGLETPLEPFEGRLRVEHFDNMIVFNNMAGSGSTLFTSLLDGHKNIVNIPILGGYVPLKVLYERRLQYIEGLELAVETASQMTPYLTSQFDDDVFTPCYVRVAALRFYLDEHGVPERRIYVDACAFTRELYMELAGRGRVTFAVLLKAIYAAYANARGQRYTPGEEYWLFFDRHSPAYDLMEMDALMQHKDFKRIEYWHIIREPVQHCFSWLRRRVTDENIKIQGAKIREIVGRPGYYRKLLSCGLGIAYEKSSETADKIVRFIRFEDVKKHMEGTMRAVCSIMGLPYDECLLDTTFNGIPVYFSASNTLDSTAVLSARDNTALNRRDFSAFMTTYDIFRLNLAFRRFKLTFGYDCDVPDPEIFSSEFLRELYAHPFKFEGLLDKAGAEAFKHGFLLSGEHPACHDHIVKLFLDCFSRGEKPELFSDIIMPEGI